LSEIKESNAETIFQIRSNIDVMKYVDMPLHQSINDSLSLIENCSLSFENKLGISWGIHLKGSNKLIGYAGIWRITREHFRGEVGYAMLPEFWSNGLMSEALSSIIKCGFEKLGLHSLEANINPANKDSIKLIEKLGFKQEAYFIENYYFDGKFIDSAIYSLLESSF